MNVSGEWKKRGSELISRMPSAMLPIGIKNGTDVGDFRVEMALDPDLEKQVDRRRQQGRIGYFQMAARVINPLETIGTTAPRSAIKLNEIMHCAKLWSMLRRSTTSRVLSLSATEAHADLTRTAVPAATVQVQHMGQRLDLNTLRCTGTDGPYTLVLGDEGGGEREPRTRALTQLAQVLVALRSLEAGGALVLKVLDTSHTSVVTRTMWLLCQAFSGQVLLFKPAAVRPCSTELFVVATGATPTQDRTELERTALPWFLRMISGGTTEDTAEGFQERTLQPPHEFCTYMQYVHLHFEGARHVNVRLALQVTKSLVEQHPMLRRDELRKLQEACGTCSTLSTFANEYHQKFPMPGVQQEQQNMQKLLESLDQLVPQ